MSVGAISAGIAAAIVQLFSAAPSLAEGNAGCPHGFNPNPNWFAVACKFTYLQAMQKVSTSFQNVPMYKPVGAGGHMLEDLWAYGDGCGTGANGWGAWLEIGLVDGFINDGSLGNDFYGVFRQSWWSNGNWFGYYVTAASSDYSNHSYEIDSSTNLWSIYFDGNVVGYETAAHEGQFICKAQSGQETTENLFLENGIAPDIASTGSFYSTPLKYTDANGTLHNGWDVNEWWIDWPCWTYQPGCYNGGFVNGANNNWSSGKV
jgi:hypothetical protein